jgi:hypothetical protein
MVIVSLLLFFGLLLFAPFFASFVALVARRAVGAERRRTVAAVLPANADANVVSTVFAARQDGSDPVIQSRAACRAQPALRLKRTSTMSTLECPIVPKANGLCLAASAMRKSQGPATGALRPASSAASRQAAAR